MSELHLFTDGSCWPNPGGPGGWAFLLEDSGGQPIRQDSGYDPSTTNNRMEMTAAIRGLEAIPGHRRVTLFTDSTYLVRGINTWIPQWTNGTGLADCRRPNSDLWARLHRACSIHQVAAQHVRAHNGHRQNEECDRLAKEASQQ